MEHQAIIDSAKGVASGADPQGPEKAHLGTTREPRRKRVVVTNVLCLGSTLIETEQIVTVGHDTDPGERRAGALLFQDRDGLAKR